MEGFVWRHVLYVKCIQSSPTSPKNRNRVPDVHHERLTQQSHVVNLTSKLTSGAEINIHLSRTQTSAVLGRAAGDESPQDGLVHGWGFSVPSAVFWGERASFTPPLVHFVATTNGRILIILTALDSPC